MPEDIPENSLTKTCPNCGKDVRADANFCKYCANQFDKDDGGAEEEEEPELEEPEGDRLDECPDCGADLSRIPSERLADCPICGTDLSAILEPDEPEVTPADLDQCPECAEDLTSIPGDMRLVCPNCRVDLEEAIEESLQPRDADAGGGRGSAGGGGRGAGGGRGSAGAGRGSAGAGRNRGAGQGSAGAGRNQGAGQGSAGAGRNQGAGQGSVGAGRGSAGAGRGSRGGSAQGGGHGGSAQGGHGGGDDYEMQTRIEREPQEIVFEVMGREIRAREGDKVGREIRTAMVEAGASEDDAVYVHREHARVDKEGGDFYLARIGENSLKVNGQLVGENQRLRVSDGDQVAFSEVVTANVRIE